MLSAISFRISLKERDKMIQTKTTYGGLMTQIFASGKRTVLFREPLGDKNPRGKCSLGCREDLGKAGTFRGVAGGMSPGQKRTHTSAHMCSQTHICSKTCMWACIFALLCSQICMFAHMCAYMCSKYCMCARICWKTHMCACICLKNHICACMCSQKYIEFGYAQKNIMPPSSSFLLTSRYFHWIGPLGQFSL